MTQRTDGMNYAPKGKPSPVVKPGEFCFAAAHLDHGHIYGQCNGLLEAGAQLLYVYDPVPARVEYFLKTYPGVTALRSEQELLEKKDIQLVASAAVPNQRGPFGCRVMEAGKDYFSDKSPFTTLGQLAQARETVARTKKRYMVYYSERLHVESAVFAGNLVAEGAIGRVVQVVGFGPHRLNAKSRPEWFFKKECYGGILCDIGSHQAEQYLFFSGAKDAKVMHAAVGNVHAPGYPELEDFGEVSYIGDNGTSNYCRVDWLTPDGLGTWGDGRTIILGTDGYIELRKYIDVGRENTPDHVYLVNQKGEKHLPVAGQVGCPFFGEMILDLLNRTEKAMTQEHIFKAAEISMQAQAAAVRLPFSGKP